MNARVLAVAVAALLAVACGSSSSSKKTPSPTTPSATYVGPSAQASFSGSTDKASVASVALGAGDMLGSMSSMGVLFGARAPQGAVGVKETLALAADLYHRPGAATAAGAVLTDTQACTGGGTVAVITNHQNANDTISTSGDYVQVTFTDCKELGSTLAMNGGFKLTIDQTAGADFVALASSITTDRSFGLTLAFDNYSGTDAAAGGWFAIDGDISISLAASVAAGTITYGISGTAFDEGAYSNGQLFGFRIEALAGQPKYHDTAVETYTGMGTLNATLTSSTADLDARLCSTGVGGCVDVNTNPVFTVVSPDNYPSSGAMTVTAGSDWVKLTALDAVNAQVSWSIGGVTGNQNVLWTDL